MDHSARIRVSQTDESSAEQSPIKEQLWPMSLKQNEGMESEPYPERLREQDCAYYMRTGLCSFGMSCRFNHPPKRKLVIAAERLKGDYPERIGVPECQYFLKTGVCKFGATCKFHHPKEKAGISGRAVLNMLGYPLRLDEKECAYYMRTGQCKFGSTCKFHHPQPSSLVVPLNGSSVYSPATPGQQSYPGGIPWSRTSFVSSPRWQGPSNYTQMLLPGMLPVTGWNTYTMQSPSDAPEQASANGHLYSASQETEAMSIGIPGSFSSCLPIPSSLGFYAVQKENIFPERPGQPDCQFYMKTGDCKFGSVCRFHHPKERLIPVPNSLLSPLGLPLRPGEQLCTFYCRYGLCKFGPSCKFDHPIRTYPYNASLSSRPPVNRSEPNLQRR